MDSGGREASGDAAVPEDADLGTLSSSLRRSIGRPCSPVLICGFILNVVPPSSKRAKIESQDATDDEDQAIPEWLPIAFGARSRQAAPPPPNRSESAAGQQPQHWGALADLRKKKVKPLEEPKEKRVHILKAPTPVYVFGVNNPPQADQAAAASTTKAERTFLLLTVVYWSFAEVVILAQLRRALNMKLLMSKSILIASLADTRRC